MKKHYITSGPFTFYLVIVLAGLLVMFYLFRVITSLSAFAYYQKFSPVVLEQEKTGITEQQQDVAITAIKTAIRYDGNNPRYAYDLGSHLHEYYAKSQSKHIPAAREQGFQESELWLRKAAMLDPASPWYYYELGRLGQHWGDCPKKRRNIPADKWKNCSVTRYFSAALNNAPNSIFLRASVAKWYYRYDRPMAYQLIWKMISGDQRTANPILEYLWQQTQNYVTLRNLLPNNPDIDYQFSKFLYHKRLDYESDLEAQQALFSKQHGTGACTPTADIRSSSDDTELELRYDDGKAEWRTYLASEDVRVKKMFCLPANLDRYNYAVLKIFMNSGIPGEFIADFSIDGHLIQRYTHTISHEARWYEIPFDNTILQGKSSINVYIRVTGASASGNFLQIWGDQDTLTTQSVFNFDVVDDLSFDNGIQSGEYMIRLVFRKL